MYDWTYPKILSTASRARGVFILRLTAARIFSWVYTQPSSLPRALHLPQVGKEWSHESFLRLHGSQAWSRPFRRRPGAPKPVLGGEVMVGDHEGVLYCMHLGGCSLLKVDTTTSNYSMYSFRTKTPRYSGVLNSQHRACGSHSLVVLMVGIPASEKPALGTRRSAPTRCV